LAEITKRKKKREKKGLRGRTGWRIGGLRSAIEKKTELRYSVAGGCQSSAP
jgi:hypothetical protein